jgi:hypothetical protein
MDEASARAVNAEPWKPLPGMVKRQCLECHYFFATWPSTQEERCADCATAGVRGVRSVSPMTP